MERVVGLAVCRVQVQRARSVGDCFQAGGELPLFRAGQRSRFGVRLDDDLVLSGSTAGIINSPSIARAGRPAGEAGPTLMPFNGFITEAIPVPASAATLTSSARNRLHYGPWRLRVTFPAEAPHGYHDPLLVSGVAGKGDFIYAF